MGLKLSHWMSVCIPTGDPAACGGSCWLCPRDREIVCMLRRVARERYHMSAVLSDERRRVRACNFWVSSGVSVLMVRGDSISVGYDDAYEGSCGCR